MDKLTKLIKRLRLQIELIIEKELEFIVGDK